MRIYPITQYTEMKNDYFLFIELIELNSFMFYSCIHASEVFLFTHAYSLSRKKNKHNNIELATYPLTMFLRIKQKL